MVATIIRRKPVLHILKDKKRALNEISKTGVHTNSVVNAAIKDIELKQVESGTGTSTSSTTVPWLLAKRRQLRESGEHIENDD